MILVDIVIFRTKLFAESAKYTFPEESNVIPVGPFNVALVASPPSPLYPAVPVPAIVLIMPADTV